MLNINEMSSVFGVTTEELGARPQPNSTHSHTLNTRKARYNMDVPAALKSECFVAFARLTAHRAARLKVLLSLCSYVGPERALQIIFE